MRTYAAYLLASPDRSDIAIGVHADLGLRVPEHIAELAGQGKAGYRLVHVERSESVEYAILRRRTLEDWPHDWLCLLIERENPGWRDLLPDYAPAASQRA